MSEDLSHVIGRFILTGMFAKIAVKGENPKLRTMSGPKVVMPPEGIDTAVSSENQIHVFRSIKHSQTWSHLHLPEAMPCWFMRRRSIAITFSSWVRKRAFMGESASQMNTITEKTTVRRPQNKKMI